MVRRGVALEAVEGVPGGVAPRRGGLLDGCRVGRGGVGAGWVEWGGVLGGDHTSLGGGGEGGVGAGGGFRGDRLLVNTMTQ